jgi:hypothetical protein
MKKINLFKTLAAGALALLVMFSPVLASAHNEKDSRNSSCVKAFGHLIAPGWLKVKGNAKIKIGDNCRLPFGIMRKLNNGNNGGQEDRTAPVISNINSWTSTTNALIGFSTDEKASVKIFYGTTAPIDINNSATLQLSDSNLLKLHAVNLVNLTANTKYYAVVQAKDASGNISTSSEFNFTTKAVVDNSAPLITNVSSSATNSGITVTWTTNEPSSSKVFYGIVTPVNTSSAATTFVASDAMVTSHSVLIPSLTANTQYYLVIQSKDASNNVSSSTELGVKTAI